MDTTNLRKLIEESNMSQVEVADACGIAHSTLAAYCRGSVSPSVDALISLADLFAVPLDYICGRCTQEECEVIEENFADNFKLLRKETYETLTLKLRDKGLLSDKYFAPYPYNLLDDIFGKAFDHAITENEQEALSVALHSLTDREQQGIRYYYQEEMTYDEIGKIFCVGRERVRQIIAKALRKMRHPSRSKPILCADLKYRLKEKELELDSRERMIKQREEEYGGKKETFSIANDDDISAGVYRSCPYSLAFENLDLSVRSYNCCLRAGLGTVAKLLEAIKTPDHFITYDSSLIHIRNLGRRSYSEILDKVEKATGEDLSDYRGGFGIFDAKGRLIGKDIYDA